MRITVVMACFMPWILFVVWKFVLPVDIPIEVIAITWMLASPVVIAGAILVAYREGQLSTGDR